MKKIILLFLTLPLLWACSMGEEPAEEAKEPDQEESTEEVELTEEEKLIENLPAASSLEDWNLVLVNPDQGLADNFEVNLEEVDNEQRIDERIVKAWTNWKEAASEAGHSLFLASAYRDVERQRNNFNRKVNLYLDEGLSEEEAKEKAKEYLTEPGHSEHHTGLALDIVDEEWIVAGNGLDTEYENEASQKWLVDTMADYGFILRYPRGKEAITKIEYEPWHFRYVGEENARFILENDLALEEYIDIMQKKSN